MTGNLTIQDITQHAVGASTRDNMLLGKVTGAGSNQPVLPPQNLQMTWPVGVTQLALLQDPQKPIGMAHPRAIIESKAVLRPEYTNGMTGSAWNAFMNQPGAVAIRQQQAMFMEMREKFYAEYEGKSVAFADGKILAADANHQALLRKTRELRQERPVLIIQVLRHYPPVEL